MLLPFNGEIKMYTWGRQFFLSTVLCWNY